jgi:murein DD-endopeptidase MepM/ murein hydrolase activator NlpD
MPYKDAEVAKAKRKEYREKNKEKVKEANRLWRLNNPDKVNAIYARYRKTDKRKAAANKWARNNREQGLKRFVERYNTDIQFNLAIKFRRRIYMALRDKYTEKATTTIDLLGCSYEYFKEYIESKFTEGMTWDKILSGEIHLDHIYPVSKFDLTNIEEQKTAFGYKNMQPLWAADNMKKYNKILSDEHT